MSRRYDVLGVLLVVAGLWLWFDLASTLSMRPLRTHGWQFCLPFFVVCFDSGHWTLAADIAIALNLAGAYLLRFDGRKPNLSFLRSDLVRTLILAIGTGVAVLLLLVGLDPLKLLLG
jgi:hypothetical protein